MQYLEVKKIAILFNNVKNKNAQSSGEKKNCSECKIYQSVSAAANFKMSALQMDTFVIYN